MTWLATGRQKDNWEHTSQLLFVLVNANRDPKTSVIPLSVFNPFAPRRTRKREKMPITMLRDVFFGQATKLAPAPSPLIGGGKVSIADAQDKK